MKTPSLAAVSALFFSLALPAQAAEKVEVVAEVVLASTSGNLIDPPSLARMKAEFAQFKFTSFKRLSQQTVVLSGAPTVLNLPNKKKVTLKLESLKAGVATIGVDSPPLKTSYTLGREGSVYITSGKHAEGDLVLVLSPVEGAKG